MEHPTENTPKEKKTGVFSFLFSSLAAFFLLIWNITRWVFKTLFGNARWTPPRWLQLLLTPFKRYGCFLSRRPWLAAAHVFLPFVLIGVGYAAWLWYEAQPKPVATQFTLTPPSSTRWENDVPKISSLFVNFSTSVAPLDQLEKTITQGIELNPTTPGQWVWRTDRQIEFIPEVDWKIGTEYSVSLHKDTLLAEHIHLATHKRTFRTSSFTAHTGYVEFHQDPVVPEQKKVIATVSFSHPVDPVSFERRIRIEPDKGLELLDKNTAHFSVVYAKDLRTAHIHTAAISVPKLDRTMKVVVSKGVQPKAGGNSTAEDLYWVQEIPGRGKLKVASPHILIAEKEGKPEQILSFTTNAPVLEKDIRQQLKIWLLPSKPLKAAEQKKFWGWHDNNITPEIIKASQVITPHYLPGEHESAQTHHLRLDLPPKRQLLIQIDSGLTAVGGYELAQRFSQVVDIPEYPALLQFMSEGSVLAVSGDKKLAILSRGVSHLHYEIQHILPSQVHHFINNNYQDLSTNHQSEGSLNPIIERYESQLVIPHANPKNSTVTPLDLKYFLNQKGIQHGLFVINMAAGKDKPYYYPETRDTQRLVMLTDLGLIVKKNRHNESDLFVVSIATGQPVANATAELIAQNGQTLQTVTTDRNGHARFQPMHNQTRERSPLAFVVKKEKDSAFIAYHHYGRSINYSRFDVEGDNDIDHNQMSAYSFSDRKLYRPGESARLMYIVRTGDWQPTYEGLPIQLEVHDPRGISLLKERRRLHVSGFDALELPLPETALTGEYTFRISQVVNGRYQAVQELGSMHFNVREFEADRLKVTARLYDKPVKGWLKPSEINATVDVQHLFGTPAAGARVTADMRLTSAYPQFSTHKDYEFLNPHNPAKRTANFEDDLGELTTDDHGQAQFNLDLSRFAEATYLLFFNTTSYEQGSGRGVHASANQLISEADYMVGHKADGELNLHHHSERTVHFVALNQHLDVTPVNDLTVELIELRHISVLAQQSNGTYRYVSREREYPVSSQNIALNEAGYSLKLDSSTPGNFLVRLRNNAGQLVSVLAYQVAGTANLTRSLERNAELNIRLDKKEYKNGEPIDIHIIAPYTGTGLITIERDRVYASQWFTTDTTSSVQTIRLPEGIEGNAYINVQFIRSMDSPDVYMSPLSVGVAPFNINRQARMIDAQLTVDAKIKPGEALNMTLNSAESGRAVIVAVDEGILQVARFTTPNPLAHFLQKRRLQVDTQQMLDLILPDFTQIMAAAAGGDAPADALAQNLNPFKKKRQPPVVWWSGIQEIKAGQQHFSFTAPDYFNGRVRVYAIVANERKVQVVETASVIQGDIILSPTVPPAVSPKDEVNLAVSVYNNLAQSGTAKFQVSLAVPEGSNVLDGAEKTIELAEGKETLVEFRVKFGHTPGENTVVFQATHEAHQATYRESISVRPASPYRTVLHAGMISGNESAQLNNLRQLHTEHAQSHLSLAASPLLWAQGLTTYLNHYAHQCTEQLTSRAIPQLLLSAYQDIPEAQEGLSTPDVLRILRNRQNDEGGFGLWMATPNASPYSSLFALQFLLEAKDRHQAVPEDMLNQALAYTQHLVKRPQHTLADLRMAALGAYLIARSGQTPGNLLTELQADLETYFPNQWQNDLTAGYLAAAFALQQQPHLALPLMKNLPWTKKKDRVLVYQDTLTEQAIHLYLLSKHFPELLSSIPDNILLTIGQAISEQRYHSHSAAWLILALESYQAQVTQHELRSSVLYSALQDGKTVDMPLSLQAGKLAQRADLPLQATALTLNNEHSRPLFYSVTQSGFDRLPAPASSQGLEIARDFISLEGKALKTITVGDEFLVRLRIRAQNKGQYEQLALVDLLPGGIEPIPVIREDHDDHSEADYDSSVLTHITGPWSLDYDNLRDDRLLLYGMLHDSGVAELHYKVRAVSAGRFTVPAAYLQAMYQPELFAITALGELVIQQP